MTDEARDDNTEPMAPVAPAADDSAVPSVEQTKEMPASAPAWSGRAQVPPVGAGLRDSAPYPVADTPPRNARAWWTPVLLGMLALGLLGLVVLAAWLMGRDTAPEPQITVSAPPVQSVAPSTTAPATTTAETTTSPTPSPTPRTVSVPALEGMSQDDATAELDRVGLTYDFDYQPSSEPEGTVIETRPGAGASVEPGTKILLVISTGPQTSSPPASPTTAADGG